jgi:hypothetical protein
VRDQIDFEVGDLHHRCLCRRAVGRRATRERADARQQFGKRERLDEIVVGAVFETAHAVFDLVARGQHQHRCVRWRAAGAAQRLQDAEAIDAGQHHVEQHQVVFAAERQAAAFDAVGRHIDHVAVFAEPFDEVIGQAPVVFDDEQFHDVDRREFMTAMLTESRPPLDYELVIPAQGSARSQRRKCKPCCSASEHRRPAAGPGQSLSSSTVFTRSSS